MLTKAILANESQLTDDEQEEEEAIYMLLQTNRGSNTTAFYQTDLTPPHALLHRLYDGTYYNYLHSADVKKEGRGRFYLCVSIHLNSFSCNI